MQLLDKLESKYGATMTPKDAADVLHAHPNHVRELCREGKLPAVQIGDRWRIPTAKFAALVDGSND